MCKEIPLTKGHVALVDDSDYERVSRYSWAYSGGRAVRTDPRTRKTVLMHRFIMNAPDHLEIDHVDGDPLNNQRSNLRFATHAQNARNRHAASGSSQYKGVYFNKQTGRWRANIRVDGRQTFLGSFTTEREAAEAYDQAAHKHHGEFAWTNFR